MVFPAPSGTISLWVTNESYKCVLFASKDGDRFQWWWYLSNERQLQVGPVDLATERRDRMRKGRIVLFILPSTSHLYKKCFLPTLCNECYYVHIDLLPAFVVACLQHTSNWICILHPKMCVLLLVLHASVHRTFIHMSAYVLNALKNCSSCSPLCFPLTFCPINIRGRLGLTKDLNILISLYFINYWLQRWGSPVAYLVEYVPCIKADSLTHQPLPSLSPVFPLSLSLLWLSNTPEKC